MNFLNKAKDMATGFKDQESGKSGYAGLAEQGKQTMAAYKADAADGQVDWAKLGKDGVKDFTAKPGAVPAAAAGPAEGAQATLPAAAAATPAAPTATTEPAPAATQ